MKEEEYYERRDDCVTIQPRLYSFDSSWDSEIYKLKQSGSLKLPIIIDHIVRSGNLFYISLISGQLLRWCPDEVITNLIILEPPVGINLDQNNKNKSSQAPQIFVDQTGDHALIVQTTGETWYLHFSQTKARYIQKLSSYSIQSVAWNSWESSRNSAVSVIIGCKKGTILTTILGPDISSNSTVIRILYEISGKPILSIFLDSILIKNMDEKQISESEFNKQQYFITVATPNKLLLWYGQNRIIDLFSKNEDSYDSSKFCIEIGSIETNSLNSKIRMLEISNHYFLIWINSRNITIYSINRNQNIISDVNDYILKMNYFDFILHNSKVPNSIECSRYHIIALFDEYIDIISPITAKSISKISINSFPNQIKGEVINEVIENSSLNIKHNNQIIKALAVELSSNFNNLNIINNNLCKEEIELLDKIGFIWGYNNENIYKINIINEGETLWKEWLYVGMYEESLISSDKILNKTLRSKKKTLIKKLQFIDLMRRGKIKQGAHLLSLIDDGLSFNEICNMFIYNCCWEGLIIYLTSKLEQLKSNHKELINANSPLQDETFILKFISLNIWLIELNSFISFTLKEENMEDKYCSNLMNILRQVNKIDEIEAIVYKILVQYNRRIAIQYYSDLRKDWHILVQEYIVFGIINSKLIKKCFEIFISIDNISKRDKLLIQYSPILSFLDPNRFISLLKRPSFSSIDINVLLPYIISLNEEHKDNQNEEIDKLCISLIEYFLTLNNKQNIYTQIERVSTRVKLLIHTETWKGNKTIWNVLAILCSKLKNGEELLLSYITPLLGKAKREQVNNTNLADVQFDIEFDLPFLLSICKTKQYKKLMAYVYCLLGLYDSAMNICLKELNNTKLTKDIIYNFIESYHHRRKWILNLIKPLGYNRDIQGLTKLLTASPKYILTLSDILTVIPDDIQLKLLSNIISNNITQYDELLIKRTRLYNNYKQSYENLLTDLLSSHNSYNVIDPQNDLCYVCFKNLFEYEGFTFENIREFIFLLKINYLDQLQFNNIIDNFFAQMNKNNFEQIEFGQTQYFKFLNDDLNNNILVFPCSHSFHFGCMLLKYTYLMNHDEINKLKRIIENICKHSILNKNKNIDFNQNSNINNAKSNNILSSLYKQLLNFINHDCLICGELMIRNIEKPFIDENYPNFDDDFDNINKL